MERREGFAAAGFVAPGFAAAVLPAAGWAPAAFAESGLGFKSFRPGLGAGFLALAADSLGLGLEPVLEALGGGVCFLGAGFAAAGLGFAGFLGGETGAYFLLKTEAWGFFFKLWPEGVFFFPPVLEGLLRGLALLGETFEEADLAAGFFLLATLSPSSMKAGVDYESSNFPPRNGRKALCQF